MPLKFLKMMPVIRLRCIARCGQEEHFTQIPKSGGGSNPAFGQQAFSQQAFGQQVFGQQAFGQKAFDQQTFD
jgi:hypothetical protein